MFVEILYRVSVKSLQNFLYKKGNQFQKKVLETNLDKSLDKFIMKTIEEIRGALGEILERIIEGASAKIFGENPGATPRRIPNPIFGVRRYFQRNL